MGQDSVWVAIANNCLEKAYALLKKDTTPTADTIEVVSKLVMVAIEIDKLNLLWVNQSRFCGAVHSDSPFQRKPSKNSTD